MHTLKLWFTLLLLCVLGTAVAGKPVWTFTALTDTQISVARGDTAIIDYLLTSQTVKSKRLYMRPITGITQVTVGAGLCDIAIKLDSHDSCTLRLEVDGDALTQPILGGPVVCEGSTTLQCYEPALKDILKITQSSGPVPSVTAVSPVEGPASGGSGVTLTGSNFSGATIVTFGGVAATSVNIVDDTTITAVTPAHAEGLVDVVVTDSAGSGRLSDGFTYLTTTVGQPAFGGVVACLNEGLNNLIAAVSDNATSIQWGMEDIETGATSTTDGAANTTTIVSVLGGGNYAAKVCSDYEVDSQGNTPCEAGNTCYNEWFLPAGNNVTTSGQLNCLYENRVAIGNFDLSDLYWSSTEYTEENAWTQFFVDGTEYDIVPKAAPEHVRCVHAFEP